MHQFTCHLHQKDDIVRMYMIELNFLKLDSSSGTPILTADIKEFTYISHYKLTILWCSLSHINTQIHISDAWNPPPVRDSDNFLTDQFRARGFNYHTITLADTTNPHGTHIKNGLSLGVLAAPLTWNGPAALIQYPMIGNYENHPFKDPS